MTITVVDFRNWIVVPALDACRDLGAVPYGRFSVDLLIATAAHETALGASLVAPLGAVSPYGLEPATIDELMSGYVMSAKVGDRPRFADLFHAIQPGGAEAYHDLATHDLRFATVLAHLHYYRQPQSPPIETTLHDLFVWYSDFWDTPVARAATEDSFSRALKAHTDLPFTH